MIGEGARVWNWGILGCGHIAEKFAADLALTTRARLLAVASRSPEKAAAFAARFGDAASAQTTRAYDSYAALAADPDIDIVYIATPHSHHAEHTMLCLKLGKSVLCEKAFALNLRQATLMVETARLHHCFLMEAFWTRFHPAFDAALSMAKGGEMGRLRMVRADFAFRGRQEPWGRLYNPELGGGSLLDVGVYPVFTALSALGMPSRIQAQAVRTAAGIDELLATTFLYDDGRMASLSCGIAAWSSVQAEFWCEQGFIRLNRRFNTPTTLTVCREHGREELVALPEVRGFGYTAEAEHVMDCLEQGLKESPVLPLASSLELMSTLDQIRELAGIGYPADS